MIKLNNLSISRGAKVILRDADLTVFPKEKLGLIGHNGAGKSSLLSALLGSLGSEAGNIDIPKAWVVATMSQEVADQDSTVIDFVLGGDKQYVELTDKIDHAQKNYNDAQLGELYDQMQAIDGFTAPARASTILAGLGFKPNDLKRKVGEFSGGWQMRMNLARVLGSRADLLLLDEPTNHLDIDAVLWLQGWIRSLAATVIVVSHDRDFLDETCTHIAHLHDVKLTKYTGGYTAFELAFAEKNAQIEQANKKSQAQIAHLESFINRFKAKATKAKQAQSRIKRLEKIQLIERSSVVRAAELSFPDPLKAPDPIVILNKVSCGYGESRIILEKVTLEIRPGDRIGLLGANGNGKTTLVKTLVGQLNPIHGDRIEGKGMVAGYFAQNEIESLDLDSSPLEHLKRLDSTPSEQSHRSFLARYHFGEDKIHQKVEGFSGGEKSRLALALIAYRRPNLLLLDEPTNHLDIASRQSLASGLLDYPGALVVVSHDRHLLESITDKYLQVANGTVNQFDGDLDDYANQLKSQSIEGDKKQSTQVIGISKQPNLTSKSRSHDETKRLKAKIRKLEKVIESLQSESSDLDNILSNIDYSDPEEAQHAAKASATKDKLLQSIEESEEELLLAMMELDSES